MDVLAAPPHVLREGGRAHPRCPRFRTACTHSPVPHPSAIRPDYALAAAVKKSISIPVILSGNVINWATAKMAYEQTGVDGFLIGRGLWSKPWKLHELSLHSQGLPFQVDSSTIFSYARQHLELLETYYGSHGLYCFRKHLPFYLRGVPDATTIRNNLVMSDSSAYVKEQLEALGAQRF